MSLAATLSPVRGPNSHFRETPDSDGLGASHSLVTALAHDRTRTAEADFGRHLVKPVDPVELKHLLTLSHTTH